MRITVGQRMSFGLVDFDISEVDVQREFGTHCQRNDVDGV